MVAIDGPAGSGKTTLADALGAPRGDASLHLDDLYEGWSGLEGSLWPRLARPGPGAARAAACPAATSATTGRSGAFAEWVDVPVPDLLVVEGCGSARRAVDPVAVLRVWVEAPDDLRLERGLARDGADAREHWLTWMADEAAHFARERTRERADVRLDAFGAARSPDADGVLTSTESRIVVAGSCGKMVG